MPVSTTRQAAGSFSSFLEQDRAYGFSELGLFGTAHAISFGVPDDLESAKLRDVVGGQSPSAIHSHSARREAATGYTGVSVLSQFFAVQLDSNLPQAVSELIFASEDPGRPAPETSTERTESVRCGAIRAFQQPDERQSDIALQIVAEGQSLKIVARGRDDNKEGRVILYRLLEETAARFGVTITEFQMNGRQIVPHFSYLLGGRHGNFTG